MHSVPQREDVHPEQANHEKQIKEIKGCPTGHQTKQAEPGAHQPYHIKEHTEEPDWYDFGGEIG